SDVCSSDLDRHFFRRDDVESGRCLGGGDAKSLSGARVEHQGAEQGRIGTLGYLGRVDSVSELQETIVRRGDPATARRARLFPCSHGNKGIEETGIIDALLAGKIRGKGGSRRIAGCGGTVPGENKHLTRQARWQMLLARCGLFDGAAARVALADCDIVSGGNGGEERVGAGSASRAEQLAQLLHLPGPVEAFGTHGGELSSGGPGRLGAG